MLASTTLYASIDVVNPGDWFGKTWLVEMGGSYVPRYLIIEADTMQDAIDVLADSKYGHEIIVPVADYGDYPEGNRTYAGNTGHVVNLDNIWLGRREAVYHTADGDVKAPDYEL